MQAPSAPSFFYGQLHLGEYSSWTVLRLQGGQICERHHRRLSLGSG
jgi:hypothetical protein